MAWTAPRTWVSGEVVSAAIMNTHVRDNLLQTAPNGVPAVVVTDSAPVTTNASTTSGTLTDITGLTVPVTSRGGKLEIAPLPTGTNGAVAQEWYVTVAAGYMYVAAVVGATTLTETRFGGVNGLGIPVSSFKWATKPAAGTYTVKLQWRQTGGATVGHTTTSTGGIILRVIEYLNT